MEESVLFKNKLKSFVKTFRRKKISQNGNLSDSDISPKRPGRPGTSSGMKRSKSEFQLGGDDGDQYLLPDAGQNLSNMFLKKEVFDREISDCVSARQASSIVEELINKRETLVQERSSLESEKDKLGTYLAEHPDATDAEYKQMTDLEDRLEILNAEIKYLTNARIKSAQEEASDISTSLEPSFSYDNALTILKTLTVSEAEDMFHFVLEDLIALRVSEKARKITEGSLHKTVLDLRHTLQLMRKAAVDSAIEHEASFNDLKKKYDNDIALWERRYSRLRSSLSDAKKKLFSSNPVGSMSSIPPPPVDDDDSRGRKTHRTSNSSDEGGGGSSSNIYKRSQSIPIPTGAVSEESSIKRKPNANTMPKTFSTDTIDGATISDAAAPFESVKGLLGHSGAIYALDRTKDDKLCSASQGKF